MYVRCLVFPHEVIEQAKTTRPAANTNQPFRIEKKVGIFTQKNYP